ncbi:MAG: lactate utilization protein [Thermoprotei archaeon]
MYPGDESIRQYYKRLALLAIRELSERGIRGSYVESRSNAVEVLFSIIPDGASIMVSDLEIVDELNISKILESGKYNYLGKRVHSESDPERKYDLLRTSTIVDYYIGSVSALSATGEMVIIDEIGAELASYSYGAKNVILIVGINKIVPTLDDAVKRARTYVAPIKAIKLRAPTPTSTIGKTLIIEREIKKGRITVIIVGEFLDI